MSLIEKTKQLCKVYNIKPVRSRGQNFLIEDDVYDTIIKTAELTEDDVVLEVGPGLGFLTEKLAKRVKHVIAVELDDKLTKVLDERLKARGIKNVEVVNEDILKFNIKDLKTTSDVGYPTSDVVFNYKIVANLPYQITSRFLRKYLSGNNKSSMMVLMLQKEVAERIVAKPPKMSLLAVSVQFYSMPEIIKIVERNAFWPEPKVDSAIVKINARLGFKTQPSINFEKDFFRLVRIGFSAKRKMLKNNLAGGYKINQEEAADRIKLAGFSEKCRAQELSLADWIKLYAYFK